MHTECAAVWSSQSCCQAVGSSYLAAFALSPTMPAVLTVISRAETSSSARGATREPRPASWKPAADTRRSWLQPWAARGERRDSAARFGHSTCSDGVPRPFRPRKRCARAHGSQPWQPLLRTAELAAPHGLRALPSGAMRRDRELDGARQRGAATAAAHKP